MELKSDMNFYEEKVAEEMQKLNESKMNAIKSTNITNTVVATTTKSFGFIAVTFIILFVLLILLNDLTKVFRRTAKTNFKMNRKSNSDFCGSNERDRDEMATVYAKVREYDRVIFARLNNKLIKCKNTINKT